MKDTYDFVFFTNLPSFYKINLYNEISKRRNILVVFVSNNSIIRNSDFLDSEINFDYTVISEIDYESRSKIKVFFKVFFLLSKVRYKILVFSGWETVESIPLFFLFPKRKNAIVIESSILECSMTGLTGYLKKKIINRCSISFPSGKLQQDILLAAGFSGKTYITHGVGILNDRFLSVCKDSRKNDIFKFLYVGRLSKEKNVRYLIEAFNINGLSLTIVGDGQEYSELIKMANDNIHFTGYVNNRDLPNLFSNFSALVLPSFSEAWGLVIEEAVYSGIPVMVSENVGCQFDLVKTLGSGVIFPLNDVEEFNKTILDFVSNYDDYLSNIKNLDYKKRINFQLDSYESAL